jgi:hypothetical protein
LPIDAVVEIWLSYSCTWVLVDVNQVTDANIMGVFATELGQPLRIPTDSTRIVPHTLLDIRCARWMTYHHHRIM